MSIIVGTYNLMKPNQTANKHNKAWNERKEDLLKNIAVSTTDVLCVQELSGQNENWMKTSAHKLGYDFFYASCKEGSGVGVLYKKNKFNLINKKTGTYEGEDDQGGVRTRAFVQLDLEDKTTKKISRVASMHLYGGTSRGNPLARQQIENFRQQIEENDKDISQIILAGDFNSDAKDEIDQHLNGPCTYLLKPHSNSSYTYNTVPAGGASPLIRTTNRSNRHLDWVFTGIKNTKSDKKIADMEWVPLNNQIKNASDHLLHAVKIKETVSQNQVCQAPLTSSPSSDITQELGKELLAIIERQGKITRNDVIRLRAKNKEDANNKISSWISSGHIKQVGRGRDTYYVLANAKSGSGSEKITTEKTKNSKKPSKFKKICKSIVSTIVEIFKAIFSIRGKGHSNRSHRSHSRSHSHRHVSSRHRPEPYKGPSGKDPYVEFPSDKEFWY